VGSRTTGAYRLLAPALIAAGTVLGGCYRYTPIESDASALGTEIRLRLTDAGAVTLGPVVGNRIELVDGRLSSVADTSLTLSVTGTIDRLGAETAWKGEQVTFPRSALAGVERRELDRGKSYLVGGITAGLVAVVGIGFSITGSGDSGRNTTTGTPK
jgi:hypothetical protein